MSTTGRGGGQATRLSEAFRTAAAAGRPRRKRWRVGGGREAGERVVDGGKGENPESACGTHAVQRDR